MTCAFFFFFEHLEKLQSLNKHFSIFVSIVGHTKVFMEEKVQKSACHPPDTWAESKEKGEIGSEHRLVKRNLAARGKK